MSGSGRRGLLALVGSGGALATLSRVAPAALGSGAFADCGGEADWSTVLMRAGASS